MILSHLCILLVLYKHKMFNELKMQEAQSKFSVDTEPENAISVDPLDGFLSPEGTAVMNFKRSSSSPSTGRINCKVCCDDIQMEH